MLDLVEKQDLNEIKNKIIEMKKQKRIEKNPTKKLVNINAPNNGILNAGTINNNNSVNTNNTLDNSVKNNTNNIINAPSVSVYNYIKKHTPHTNH